MSKTIARIAAVAASIALVGAVSVPAAASAEGTAVEIKGHISQTNGKPVKGAVVEVVAQFGDLHFNKGVKTSKTGRYSITVRPNAVYRINFIKRSTDDGDVAFEYVTKTGHVRVGSTDYRLDKSLRRAVG